MTEKILTLKISQLSRSHGGAAKLNSPNREERELHRDGRFRSIVSLLLAACMEEGKEIVIFVRYSDPSERARKRA